MLEDIENAAYLVATCTMMIDVFFFQLRDVKLAYCNKNEGHANCSITVVQDEPFGKENHSTRCF